MKLSAFLKELSYSEFSNLAVGDQGSGEIQERRMPSVVSAVNSALLRLYSRYLFKRETVLVKKLAGQTKYVLDSKFAESTGATNPFILDSANPFKDDILKIVGIECVIPETNAILDVARRFNQPPITIQVPRTITVPDNVPVGEILHVHYRASHPVLTAEDDGELECPPSAFEAIKAYVAYKEYISMNTETMTAKGNEYYALFQTLCEELVDKDTIGVSEDFPDNRFSARGFV